jgi:prepilin-type N-terminal cleavage/methylation domain-containing protein
MRGFRRKLAGLRPGGFTLVELAVVSAILAGLAVAVVTYVGSTSQTVNTEMTATVNEVRTGVDTSGLGQYGGGDTGPAPRVVFVSGDAGFGVNANGVTVECDGAANGASGMYTVDGNSVTFVKRTLAEIQADFSLAATSCTSGITDLSFFGFDMSDPESPSPRPGWDTFNEDISTWDVSNVTSMYGALGFAAAFNQDISAWDVSSVTILDATFWGAAAFNQDIGSWDVSNVTSMMSTFQDASAFNQDISGWDVSNVSNAFSGMFSGASAFNQDLSGWCVSGTGSLPSDFDFNATSWVLPRPNWGAACS